MKKARGFTLIELMIAVAIIGVLVAIAYPSYEKSLIKGSRAAAKTFLLEVAQKEQAYLLDNRAYFTDAQFGAVGLTVPPEVSRYYTITVTAPGGTRPTFEAKASPISTTRQKNDGWLQINQAGEKTAEVSGNF